jgi:hypothetical protein
MGLVSLRSALATLSTGDSAEHITGSKESGPRGIEAVIEYNGLYLNVRDWIDTFLVTTIMGIDDADVRDTREVNPGRHGETPGFAFYGGRTISLQGKIQTKTIWKLRDMEQALRAAFADLTQERALIFHGTGPAEDLQVYCKKSQKLDIPDTQTTLNGFERPFNITLRASNPRFKSIVQHYYQWVASTGSIDAIVFQAVNTGNFDSEPYIELSGPMTNLQLINEANGQAFKVLGTIPDGETWVYDASGPSFYRKSDLANRWSYVDPMSTEFVYVPAIPNPIHAVVSFGLTSNSVITSWNNDTLM